MRRNYNPKMKQYLLEHGEEHIIKEWVDIVNSKFGTDFDVHEMQHYFTRHHIAFKYEKPNKSNTGLAHPIGSERTKSDGMVQIKVAPHKWEYKQRYIYEQYYGVELKEDEYVIFLDRDRSNFDINNLKKVTRRESAVMANLDLFTGCKELTELGLSIAQLNIKVKEVKDERQ